MGIFVLIVMFLKCLNALNCSRIFDDIPINSIR